MLFVYRLLFPIVFLFFVPGLLIKLIRRPGHKKTYAERFAIYSGERIRELKEWQGAVWIHAVSVGETNLALTVLNQWAKDDPSQKFILGTTTTTGQEIARTKTPPNTKVIFTPIDSYFMVRRVLNLLKPSAFVIFETELWPNLVCMAHKRGIRTCLVNTRISDKSYRGYRRFRFFFAPILRCFDAIGVQTELDKERLNTICPELGERLTVTGNIKFDQEPPAKPGFDFSTVFGQKTEAVIVAASTHNPEEPLILDAFQQIRKDHPDVKLALIPRHAERGNDIEKMIKETGLRYSRRSQDRDFRGEIDILLADTTGELVGFLKSADLVIMGKTMAGNDEGQNIIEPALMGKPIVSGPKLKNFRQAMDLLKRKNAVCIVNPDNRLASVLNGLLNDRKQAAEYGKRAAEAMMQSKGALQKTLAILKA